MDSNFSLADISSVLNKDNGLGGNAFVLIVVLFLFMFMRNGIPVSGTVEGNSSTYEILQGQQFQSLNDKIDRVNNGICDGTFALNNSITSEGRATQLGLAGVNAYRQINLSDYYGNSCRGRTDKGDVAAERNAEIA